MPSDDRKDDELGALWERTSANGTQMLTGTINGVDVVAFLAKRTSEKSPTWRVLKSRPRPETTRSPRLPVAKDPRLDDDDVPY